MPKRICARDVTGLLLGLALTSPCTQASDILLTDYKYPFPVQLHEFTSQRQSLIMAYMDVKPEQPNGETVVLLHGKNFSGAYWEQTAGALRDAGYRVLMPDQIGFGKSTKPAHYQFTFEQLAINTHALLREAGVTQAHVLGHSMGGMLAVRYALMFPEDTRSLILLDPLGLEDWAAQGVPYQSIDQWYERELGQTREKVKRYQQESYYHGEWRPEYDRWVDYLVRFQESPDYERMAWNQALTYDMIYTQPVCREFHRLQMPVLLIVGGLDRTALGKDQVSATVRATLGQYPQLAYQAGRDIPHAQVIVLDGVGHLPHIEAFALVIDPLRAFLRSPGGS